jgi:hypothetical protein
MYALSVQKYGVDSNTLHIIIILSLSHKYDGQVEKTLRQRIWQFWSSSFSRLKPKLVYIIFKNSVLTAKKTQLFTIKKINWLMAFREIIAIYSNHMKPVNALCGQNAELLIIKPGGTYRYHWVLKSQTDLGMIEYVRTFVHRLQLVTYG